jgi:hypothetical protein
VSLKFLLCCKNSVKTDSFFIRRAVSGGESPGLAKNRPLKKEWRRARRQGEEGAEFRFTTEKKNNTRACGSLSIVDSKELATNRLFASKIP